MPGTSARGDPGRTWAGRGRSNDKEVTAGVSDAWQRGKIVVRLVPPQYSPLRWITVPLACNRKVVVRLTHVHRIGAPDVQASGEFGGSKSLALRLFALPHRQFGLLVQQQHPSVVHAGELPAQKVVDAKKCAPNTGCRDRLSPTSTAGSSRGYRRGCGSLKRKISSPGSTSRRMVCDSYGPIADTVLARCCPGGRTGGARNNPLEAEFRRGP